MEVIPHIENKDYFLPVGFYVQEMVNNDLCFMELQYQDFNKKRIYYGIYLRVGKWNKNVTLKQTGRNGLSCLIWAKNALITLEKYIVDNPELFYKLGKKEVYIIIFWDDNKRRDVYKHGLNKLGYYTKQYPTGKMLSKRII